MQFFRIVMAAPHSCIPFLYAIAEKGRKDKEGTDQEQARAHKRYDGLGNAVLARVHLYVNLESGHNRQRIRTPTVIHAAAFRQSRTGDDGTKRT